jgi:hypothetical protein
MLDNMLQHSHELTFIHNTLEGLLQVEIQNGRSPSLNLVSFFNSPSPHIPLDFVNIYRTDKLNHRWDITNDLIKTMLIVADPLASPTDITDCQKWIDDVHDLLPLEDQPQPDNAIDYIASCLYCVQTRPTNLVARDAWDKWDFQSIPTLDR